MTNADVIRQMTDDELYRFLGAFEVGDIDYALTSCNWCGEEIDCATCFRRWLFSDANDYKGLLADKGINSGYTDRKTEPLKGSERLLKGKTEPQKWETPPKFEHKGIQTACVSVPMALIEDEPQTNADQHVQHVESVGSVEPTWTKEEHEAFYTFLWNVINPNEMQDYIEMFETNDEPQTEEWYTVQDEQEYNDRWGE